MVAKSNACTLHHSLLLMHESQVTSEVVCVGPGRPRNTAVVSKQHPPKDHGRAFSMPHSCSQPV